MTKDIVASVSDERRQIWQICCLLDCGKVSLSYISHPFIWM